jgi:hypothetical protein
MSVVWVKHSIDTASSPIQERSTSNAWQAHLTLQHHTKASTLECVAHHICVKDRVRNVQQVCAGLHMDGRPLVAAAVVPEPAVANSDKTALLLAINGPAVR